MESKYNIARRSCESFLRADTSLCIKVNNLSGNRTLDKISYIISKIGDGPAYFLVLLMMIMAFKKPFFIVYRDFIFANMASLAFYKIIKVKIKRRRPFIAIESINKLIPPPDEFSFPSGHSAAAAVFCYCTFYHFPPIMGYIMLCWMILVGFSRVYNGVHYPGDVVIGFIMGSLWGKVILALIY